MIKTLCNGFRNPRPVYDIQRRENLIDMAQIVREELTQEYPTADHDEMLYRGWRFDNDDTLIATLESCIDQEKLYQYGDSWAVRDALLDCMSRDYYYTYEKDWGYEYGDYDDGQDCEEA